VRADPRLGTRDERGTRDPGRGTRDGRRGARDVVQLNDDALSHSRDGDHFAAFELGRSRLDRAQDERAPKSNARQRLSDDPLLQRLDVHRHIGKFRHRIIII
jgi:hypothetical protein